MGLNSFKLLLDIFEGIFNIRKNLFPDKTSPEKAKIVTIQIYQKLKSLERLTDELIEQLELWHYIATSDKLDKEVATMVRMELFGTMQKLANEIEAFHSLLKRYSLTLDLFVPDLFEGMGTFIDIRRVALRKASELSLENDILMLTLKDKAQLKGIILKAKENRIRIHEIVREFREFIIQNFDYKEMF